jgi:hypothetical protein
MPAKPAAASTSNRRKSVTPEVSVAAQLGTPVQFPDADMNDWRAVIKVCSANLAVARDFIMTSKERLGKRHCTMLALELIQKGLNSLLTNERELASNSNPPPIDESRICEIVKSAVASQLAASAVAPTPTYGAIAARTPTASATKPTQATKPAPPKHKITIVPEEGCPGVHTAEDTKRILLSRPAREYGIRVDKIVTMKDNAVLLESRCDSILKLGDSQVLKELKLKAVPIRKMWPKMQVMDVPANVTQEQLLEELSGQNLPDSVPDHFVRKIFKHGRRPSENSQLRAPNESVNYVIEVHPAARRHFLQTGRIYTSWRSHQIRDFITVTRCYNCQRYGHIAKNCNSPQACGFCSSSDHEASKCPNRDNPSNHRCVNCQRSGAKDTAHHTASNMCPIYIHRLQDIINSTTYEVDG